MSLKEEMARILAARQSPSVLTTEQEDEKDSMEEEWLAEFEEINAEQAASAVEIAAPPVSTESWPEQRARLLNPEPPAPHPPFAPGLPYFVPAGPDRWVETPYATAHCVFCPAELAEGDKVCCPEHRQIMDATAWTPPAAGPGGRSSER